MAKPTERTILFLCTGNYYRSRYAEILFNDLARKMRLPWKAHSRGLALERGVNNAGPIARGALEALNAAGIRHPEATSRFPAPATTGDFESSVLVIALKHEEHWPLMQERFPEWAEKIEYWQIDDAPEALTLIEREVNTLVARVLGGGRPAPTQVDAAPSAKQPEKVKKPIVLKVGREVAGRRGKGVTTVFDTPLNDDELKTLAGTLKQKCGTGGTVKDGRIEIQGDQRERIVAELEKLGYKVKRVGG